MTTAAKSFQGLKAAIETALNHARDLSDFDGPTDNPETEKVQAYGDGIANLLLDLEDSLNALKRAAPHLVLTQEQYDTFKGRD